MVADSAWSHTARSPDYERYAYAAFVTLAFQSAQFAVAAEELGVGATFFVRAVVACEHYYGRAVKPFFLEFVEYLAHIGVEAADHRGKLGMGVDRRGCSVILAGRPRSCRGKNAFCSR